MALRQQLSTVLRQLLSECKLMGRSLYVFLQVPASSYRSPERTKQTVAVESF